MVYKIRSWTYFFIVLGFALLGVIESTVVKNTVTMFAHLPLPAVTKLLLPIITIAIFVIWVAWILFRIGYAADEDDDDETAPRTQKVMVRIIIESPTVCIILSMIGIIMLESMKTSLISWDYARTVYSYGVLWLAITPCVSSILELVQGISGFHGINLEENNILQKSQTIDGIISFVLTIAAVVILIMVGDMGICKYMYYIYAILLVYRSCRYYHLTSTLWTEKISHQINEIDEREGIL